jgi:pimeloyl-ACP methyl ester carboxylesterase
MPYADVNGNKIYYETHGKGDALVLLNGILANTSSWFNQVPFFSKKFNVITMDFRGQGRSDKPVMRYPMELHANDLKGLLDYLKINKAHIVGISFGAEVALIFAARYPHKVKTLVTACAVSHVDSVVRSMADKWLTTARLRSGRYLFEAVYPDVFSPEFIQKRWDFVGSTAPLYDTAVDLDAFIELLKGFMQLNATSDLHRIKAPTLVIAGENDKIKPLKYSKVIQKNVANSRLAVIKGSGHTVIWEKPEEFNTLVLRFLEEYH